MRIERSEAAEAWASAAPRPLLFQPITIRGVTARNRVVASPMCQYKSLHGLPTDWHFVHMGRYAVGGAGIVFYEETAVEERGRKTHHCAGLYRDDQIPAYRRITELVCSLGAVPAIQLGHTGGKASEHGPLSGRAALTQADALIGLPPWQPISSSAVPARPGKDVPREMTIDDIREVQRSFAAAAVRSLDAGFDIVEIHGAHGYLIQQFLSPLINRRTDAYGGDRNGRMRFALELVEGVRQVWPQDKPLFFRVSSIDGEGGTWDIEDTVALAAELGQRGVDVIDCSSGGLSGPSPMKEVPRIPGRHLPFAQRVKQATGLKTMAPGLIIEPAHAERTLQNGDVDLVAMARELMMRSEWPALAARELGVQDHLDLFPEDFACRLKRRELMDSLRGSED